jgi:hypothetical protein
VLTYYSYAKDSPNERICCISLTARDQHSNLEIRVKGGSTPLSSNPIPISLHILLSLETAPNLSFPAVVITEAELKLLSRSVIKPPGQFLILLHIISASVSIQKWKFNKMNLPITYIKLVMPQSVTYLVPQSVL